jgi:hypothetical protein
MATTEDRFRVQSYTDLSGVGEWCVCDFAREAETGMSPIVTLFEGDKAPTRWIFRDKMEAERVAAMLNRGELRAVIEKSRHKRR